MAIICAFSMNIQGLGVLDLSFNFVEKEIIERNLCNTFPLFEGDESAVISLRIYSRYHAPAW